MGLFFKDSIENIRPNSNSIAPEPVGIGYNEVLDYLVALPDDDYEKLLKVANIYRQAERQVADVLQSEPATAELDKAKADLPAEQLSEVSIDDEINEAIKDYIQTKTGDAQK